ncbi:MAG: hypothetical protein AVDCRST_MAG02-829 [uncultured Rubrobacteraceae bacterium]|uniref:Uncharacterized protein n=1 Tax=uncultured Rubrobacteraceae bacterium TaxID=349277 RepID=A0A6J4QX22_9ACTN|nr:MAG: hypothetical protein AVDCRST_MAG02-829 [uncultured Rubrobacteraceae bacterium]
MLLGATMAIVAVLAVGMASADPVNSKNAQIFTFDCGGEEVTLVAIGNSRGAAFSVVDTTGNFVLMRVEGTETFTDPETGEVVEYEFEFSTGQGEKKGLQGSLTTCDDSGSFEDPELGTVTVDITVTGFFTPRTG